MLKSFRQIHEATMEASASIVEKKKRGKSKKQKISKGRSKIKRGKMINRKAQSKLAMIVKRKTSKIVRKR